jgi:hypothetical protein
MAKAKSRRPRGQVKGWVLEARTAGHKKAKEIKDYIKQQYNEVVADTQIYGILASNKGKRGRKKGSPVASAAQPAKALATVTLNGVAPVDPVGLVLSVKELAGKVGGMKKLKALLEALS